MSRREKLFKEFVPFLLFPDILGLLTLFHEPCNLQAVKNCTESFKATVEKTNHTKKNRVDTCHAVKVFTDCARLELRGVKKCEEVVQGLKEIDDDANHCLAKERKLI